MKVIVSETPTNATTHGADVKKAISVGYGSDISGEIEIRTQGFLADCEYAKSVGAVAVVRSYTGVAGQVSTAQKFYPELLCFFPLGSNDFVELTALKSVPAIVTSGASEGEHNETAYGAGLEFFDVDSPDTRPADVSSYSNGVVAGKLLKIKDTLKCGWWEARYRARATGLQWTKFDGYGRIDVQAAIKFKGKIPGDPYLPVQVSPVAGVKLGRLAIHNALSPCRWYHAYLTQSSGGNPSAVEIDNTLGVPVWSRVAEGHFQGTLTGAFGKLVAGHQITSIEEGIVQVTLKKIDNDTVELKTYAPGNLLSDNFTNLSVSLTVYD